MQSHVGHRCTQVHSRDTGVASWFFTHTCALMYTVARRNCAGVESPPRLSHQQWKHRVLRGLRLREFSRTRLNVITCSRCRRPVPLVATCDIDFGACKESVLGMTAGQCIIDYGGTFSLRPETSNYVVSLIASCHHTMETLVHSEYFFSSRSLSGEKRKLICFDVLNLWRHLQGLLHCSINLGMESITASSLPRKSKYISIGYLIWLDLSR